MERQLAAIFENIVATVHAHENTLLDKLNNIKQQLGDKDEQIRILTELCERQKCEMADFLKVSYATRWKQRAEEIQKQYDHLQEKMESISKTNQTLNHHMDKKSNLITVETQSEPTEITIQTRKGATYILKHDTLFTSDGKVVGQITDTQLCS